MIPNIVVTKTDSRRGKTYKGGVASYDQVRNTLLNTLASVAKIINFYATTMFDFYGLPTYLLGVSDAEKANAGVDVLEK